MAVISEETFNNLSRDQKRSLRKMYLTFQSANSKNKTELIESIFDKSCFENMNKDIKTWDDVILFYPLMNQRIISDLVKWCDDKVVKKLDAAAKIAKIIELGYGGIITESQWQEAINDGNGFYVIYWNLFYRSIHIHYDTNYKHFLSFRTRELAEEFMSYPENVELIRNYNMV